MKKQTILAIFFAISSSFFSNAIFAQESLDSVNITIVKAEATLEKKFKLRYAKRFLKKSCFFKHAKTAEIASLREDKYLGLIGFSYQFLFPKEGIFLEKGKETSPEVLDSLISYREVTSLVFLFMLESGLEFEVTVNSSGSCVAVRTDHSDFLPGYLPGKDTLKLITKGKINQIKYLTTP